MAEDNHFHGAEVETNIAHRVLTAFLVIFLLTILSTLPVLHIGIYLICLLGILLLLFR